MEHKQQSGQPLKKHSKIKLNKVKVKNVKGFKILSTNAAGLKHKTNDLKNTIKYLDTSIFAIQETHFAKKGKLKLDKSTFLKP